MNFDEHIDRNQYPTLKWSKAFLGKHFGNQDAIPMSIADIIDNSIAAGATKINLNLFAELDGNLKLQLICLTEFLLSGITLKRKLTKS